MTHPPQGCTVGHMMNMSGKPAISRTDLTPAHHAPSRLRRAAAALAPLAALAAAASAIKFRH